MEYKIVKCLLTWGATAYYIRIRHWWRWLPIWRTINLVYSNGERSLSPIYFNSIQQAEDYAVSYIHGMLNSKHVVVKKGIVQ